jgi:glutamyl-Q tRNA(Asp) synthetase
VVSYRGRFAPSPTGPLHFGSLVAAVGSYLEARSRGGQWLVRMEDLDRPRVVRGSAEAILTTLERFGFEWDGPVLWQSTRTEAYREALEKLESLGAVFGCGCSRREACRCRDGLPAGRRTRAWKVRGEGLTVAFTDRLQGPRRFPLDDFVVRRADGLFAYQLAVVVDDAAQGITDVVRGADLLDSTPRQIRLQQLLGWPQPGYLHLPVAVDERGEKLSKQTRAPALDDDRPLPALRSALAFLGQQPPEADLAAMWAWARANWQPERIMAAC